MHELISALHRLRDFGYEHVSLSGGEPTLYQEIEFLCLSLVEIGFSVSIISNGWSSTHLSKLASKIPFEAISISFDGTRLTHDKIRRAGSYSRALDSLRMLRNLGSETPIGCVVSVTELSLPQLPDLVEVVASEGAAFTQLHPIAEVGRALTNERLFELDQPSLSRIFLLANVLSVLHDPHIVKCDVVSKEILKSFAKPKLGELVTPLVIDENGSLLPIAYGVDPKWELGTLLEPEPFYNESLLEVVERTLSYCENQRFATVYPDFVRESAIAT